MLLLMSHVHTWPQLIEDLKFNKSCPTLIFIWQDVISAGAPAPRQGLCPRPCSHHPPSGPLHLPASCSIPTQLSAEALHPTQPPAFLHPSPIPSCLAPLSQDSQEPFQAQRPGHLPAIGCLAVIYPVTYQDPSLVCF